MADQSSTYSRIYDLKAVGADKVVGQINSISQAFEKLAAIKKGVSFDDLANGVNENASAVSAGLTKIQSSYKQTIDVAKAATEAAKQETEASKQAANAKVAAAKEATEAKRQELDASKAVTEQSKQSTEQSKQEAAAKIAEAKTNLDNTRAKEIEARMNERYLAQLQRIQAARDKAQTQLAREQTAMFQVKQEYKESAQAAEELGAQYYILAREIHQLESTSGANVAPGMTADISAKKNELQSLGITMKDAQGKALELHAALLKIEQAVGKSQRNVGNYNSAVMAMSQILREAPSFAYSFATGLLAISNNVPILVDEITRLKKVNEELTAAGGKAIPIWKTLSQALTSPVGVITIITSLITIFAARMTMAGNAVSKAVDSQKKYNDAIKSTNDAIMGNVMSEQNHAKVLMSIARDTSNAMNIRTAAVEKLQSEYPNYLGNLSKEAILTGDITKQVNALNEALFNKALLQASEQKVKAAADNYVALKDGIAKTVNELADLEKKVKEPTLDKEGRGLLQFSIIEKRQEVDQLNKALAKAKADIDKYNNDILVYGKKAAGVVVGTPEDDKKKREKRPYDYTNEILAANKKLLDEKAELETIEIQMEATKLKTIYENEENSYADRLTAYESYMGKQRELLRVESQKQIDEIDGKLQEIAKIKQVAPDKRTPEQNVLLLNEDALNAQKKVVAAKWEQERLNQVIATEKGITDLKKQEIQKRLDQVKHLNENEQIQEDAALQKLKAKLDGGTITYDAYTKQKQQIEDAFQKKRLTNLKAYLEAERAGLKALGFDTSALDEAIGAVNHQLSELSLNASERNAKKTQAIFKQVTDQMFSFAQAAGQAYFDLLSKQDAAQDNREQKQMDRSKKKLDASAQSLKERENYEKAFDLATEQREHQKAEKAKKRAEAEMIFQYSVAVVKAIAAHVGDFGIGAAIEIGGMSAIFGAQLAMLEAAPAYAKGTGNHPGGLAWVGDGGEHEFAKINNSWFVTPNTPTLTNMPAGSEVVPFSKVTNYSGTMGSQVKAPSFYSSNTGNSGGIDPNIQALTGMVGYLMSGMANMKVTLDTQAAGRAINNGYYKKTHL